MLPNYIKIALRYIYRNRLYSIINILGLAIGMACSLLLLLYVHNELTYDKYNENYKDIYRLESVYKLDSGTINVATTAVPLGPAIKDEYPEVKEYVRFLPVGREFFKYDGKDFMEEDFYYSDSSVFDVFTYRFIKGPAADTLKIPFSMVITENLAEKYFGNKDPIGKNILNRKGKGFKITGVIENLPENSHLRFDALISMATHNEKEGQANFNSRSPDSFEGGDMFTYALLKKGEKISRIIEDFDRFRGKYYTGGTSQFTDSQYLNATPLAETHFKSDIYNDRPHGNIVFVYIMTVLAVFILIISSINYLNIATACASKREKEVGLRKVMGAFRIQLIKQFLMESVIFSLMAFLFSLVLVEVLFPLFRQISGKDLSLFSYYNFELIGLAFLLSVFVGLGAGSYPAFYLSRFMPSRILGYNISSLRTKSFLRNVLVVLQFSISIIVIIATAVVFSQSDYMKNKDLGFNKEDIIIQRVGMRRESVQTSIDILMQELKHSPFIIDSATSTGSMDGTIAGVHHLVEVDGKMKEMLLGKLAVDYNYFDLMGIKLKQGRSFNPNILTDKKQAFIVNETAARQTGWGEDAIGKRIRFDADFNGKIDGSGDMDGKVIGIVRDFHIEGLRNEIMPCVISIRDSRAPIDSITIKIKPGNTAEALEFIDQKTRELNGGIPPDYFILEDKLSEFYSSEERLINILGSFSVISILISCMGLIGLSSYMTEQRTKEIGVKKVLGAKISGIIYLLAKEFLILVLISNIIAWPIAAYVMHRWLENYAYRIGLSWSLFIESALVAILTALFTVSFKAIKAASKDPVKALRYE